LKYHKITQILSRRDAVKILAAARLWAQTGNPLPEPDDVDLWYAAKRNDVRAADRHLFAAALTPARRQGKNLTRPRGWGRELAPLPPRPATPDHTQRRT
jgi:hypothetical protein